MILRKYYHKVIFNLTKKYKKVIKIHKYIKIKNFKQ